MSIRYRKQVRKVNYNGEIKTKYNAKILYSQVINERELAELISQKCSLTPADVYAAVEALISEIKNQICNGNIVSLGDLGRFKASFRANACDNLQDVSPKTIRKINCLYSPGNHVKASLKKVHLVLDLASATRLALRIGSKGVAQIIAQFPQVNKTWLVFGEGEMFNGDSESHPETPSVPEESRGNNVAVGGNASNISNGTSEKTILFALTEVSEMRKLIAEVININKEQSQRLVMIVDRIADRI